MQGGGYEATQPSPLRSMPNGLPSQGAGADYHYRDDSTYLRLIELVRDFERNDPIIRAAFHRIVSNVVQNGFTLDIDTGDPELDKRIGEELWQPWAEEPGDCDVQGELTFHEMEQLVCRAVDRDGDIFAVPTTSGHLRFYEADRCRTPLGRHSTGGIVHGVQLNQNRRRMAYYFTREVLEPWRQSLDLADMTRIAARDATGAANVFHVFAPDRISQTRGVSACAPSLDTIDKRKRIDFAKMVQQQMVSCYALLIERDSSWNPEDAAAANEGDDRKFDRDDYVKGMQRSWEKMFPGMVYDGLPGEKLTGMSTNVPNAEYFEQVMLLLTYIAVSLDLPVQVLLLDPTKTNFSGWRGAVDQARQRWQVRQKNLISKFHRRVYRWKLRQWLRQHTWLQDAWLQGGLNVFGHQWNPPAWSYIEPLTDVKADELIVRGGHNSRRGVLAKRGMNYDQVMPQVFGELESELTACAEIAVRVNEKFEGKPFGKPLDVREVAAARGIIAHGGGATLNASLDGDEGEAAKQTDPAEAAA